jgi:hypothetical protein
MDKQRAGRYYLAPASNPTDTYAAGYDDNVFDTLAEAEAAIPALCALGGEWDHEWVVGQYPLSVKTMEQFRDRVAQTVPVHRFATTALEFESLALSIGYELLPPEARAVIDGEDPTPAYWQWLADQWEEAGREG